MILKHRHNSFSSVLTGIVFFVCIIQLSAAEIKPWTLKSLDSLVYANPTYAITIIDKQSNEAKEIQDNLSLGRYAYLKAKAFWKMDKLEESAFENIECAHILIAKQVDDKDQIARCYYNAADNYYQLGLYDLSIDLLHKALNYIDHDKSIDVAAFVYSLLTEVYMNQGNYEKALIYVDSTLTIDRMFNDTLYIVEGLCQLGRINSLIGRKDEAFQLLDEAKSFMIGRENTSEYSMLLNARGLAYSNLGDCDNALDYVHQALDLSQQLEDSILTMNRFTNLGMVYNKCEKYEEAEQYLSNAIALQLDMENPKRITILNQNLGDVYLSLIHI